MSADLLGYYHQGRWAPLPGAGCTMRDFAEQVAEEHGLTVADLKGERRTRRVSHARQEMMCRAYATGRFSLTQISNFLCRRDHTTVLYGIRAHKRRAGA